MISLVGKAALVTGAGSGIGAMCARLLAARGARVVVADIDLGTAASVALEIGDTALAVEADVSDPTACERMVDKALVEFGRLDVAVNNAGVAQARSASTAELPIDEWRRVLAVNLDGVFYSMRAELPAMLRGGGGAIVNTASALGVRGLANGVSYVASKHGVVGLTRGASIEYAALGVRINAVCPGVIETPMTEHSRSQLGHLHPMGRFGRVDEVAEVVAFLASDASGFCTGACYAVDGGWTAT